MKNLIVTLVFAFLSISTINAQDREDRIERKKNRTEKTVKRNVAKNTRVVKRNQVVYANKRKPIAKRTVRRLNNTKVIVHNGRRYHYSNGRYYRNVNGRFIVATPRHFRVRTLPVGFVRVLVGARPYYYYDGIYYQQVENSDEYEIIDAPQDAILYSLPEDAEEVFINDERYFESNNTLYKVVTTPDGKAFKVAGQLEE